VREQLEEELPSTLEELRTLEAVFNEVLVDNLPPRILNRKHQVAVHNNRLHLTPIQRTF